MGTVAGGKAIGVEVHDLRLGFESRFEYLQFKNVSSRKTFFLNPLSFSLRHHTQTKT